jgi:hypothetical protein
LPRGHHSWPFFLVAVIPCRYFPSSCALVSNCICQPLSYRRQLSGGDRSFVSTSSRRELGGTAFAPIVMRASLRSRLPAAVIPSTVIRRRLFVREHVVAAGVGGNRLCLGCSRTHGNHLRPRPIQRRIFAPRASNAASRAPHLCARSAEVRAVSSSAIVSLEFWWTSIFCRLSSTRPSIDGLSVDRRSVQRLMVCLLTGGPSIA